ncbi:MAG: molecular chaperone HtpG [Peptostreptococcaceae bacterium]|nr:molecular chaperone HtpG [Peptostreptococcaceae bacterium]
MRKKQFKAESKKLLDLMINSIYTHKEIFLREIISNASDAIDKRYFKASAEGQTGLSRDSFEIRITPDKSNNTLTISDNGIGMTLEELESNLGVIASSGSLDFKNENKDSNEEIDIIGQFGVGFYSAFMVSDKIEVLSKTEDDEKAHLWTSEGVDGYTIKESEKDEIGTTLILTLKNDTEDEHYSEYLDEYALKNLVKKYSDYIRYPIVMLCEKSKPIEVTDEEKEKEDYEPKYEAYFEDDKLNSMVPIWKRNKSEITDEEYNEFYKEKFFDWTDPLKVISTNVEGVISYNALLFIPGQVPYNYYSKEYQKGLQLYSSGVSIMDKCADLLPDYFGFVRGLVDSQDLSLNISREMLQQDRQLKAIATRLEKKINSELMEMQKNDRENYDKFFEMFGTQLKFGAYEGYGAKKDSLKDLLLYYSNVEKKQVTLKEYVERMKEDQKYIYYATGESIDKIDKMPQLESIVDKNYEVLYCTEEVDEFTLKIITSYDDKEFKSVSDKDLGIELTDEEKKESKEKNEANKSVLDAVKEALGDKVTSVILSTRLKNHPVCFSSGEGLSIEMEKILKSQAEAQGNKEFSDMQAEKILELNESHEFFEGLTKAVTAEDKEKISDYANLLYDQALLIEGMSIEDPVEFSNLICKLMK